jgi:hypothetical protein
MEYQKRYCTSCENRQENYKIIKAPLPAENLNFDKLKKQWFGFFKEEIISKCFFTYEICNSCALVFCPVYFDQNQLNELYANMPDNTANVNIELLTKTQNSYFEQYQKHIPDMKGDYLEFGPDIGLFTKNLLKCNFDKLWLLEPNKGVWSVLRENLKNTNLNILEDLSCSDIPNNSLKSVVMIHVLDHLLNPTVILDSLKDKMKKGATICIVTHDVDSFMAKILGFRWPAFCLQHPQLYSPKSIKKLLENNGFKIKKIHKTKNYFPIGYLVNHLVWALGFQNFKFDNLNSISIPLKLGNIITIAELL